MRTENRRVPWLDWSNSVNTLFLFLSLQLRLFFANQSIHQNARSIFTRPQLVEESVLGLFSLMSLLKGTLLFHVNSVSLVINSSIYRKASSFSPYHAWAQERVPDILFHTSIFSLLHPLTHACLSNPVSRISHCRLLALPAH